MALASDSGFFLDNSSTVQIFGTTAYPPAGQSSVLALASNLGKTGAPFIIDSSGIYEYGATSPVTSSAITKGTQFAVSASPSGGYLFWSLSPNALAPSLLSSTDQSSTQSDFSAFSGAYCISSTVNSPMVYVAINTGNGVDIKCVNPNGVTIGSLALNSQVINLTALGVYVDPATGIVRGTATSNDSITEVVLF